jgi:hypothetical protein
MQRLSTSWAVAATAVGTLALVMACVSSGARAERTSPARTSASRAVLADDVVRVRQATAKYATNLALAKANGYGIITKMIPDMGYHFMNSKVTGFDVTKPPILVYEHHGRSWQLGAVEWVFTTKPSTPPLPGATYGAFGAGCHYKDGSYIPATAQSRCPAKAPGTGAAFNFWHPNLITLHLWVWYPNPSGIYSGTNPLVSFYNKG